MMSSEEKDVSAEESSGPPVLPPDSPGSSVSTRLQEEYTELLKYAVGMPGPDTRMLDSSESAFQPVTTRSGGLSARHTPTDQQQDGETPRQVGGGDDINTNSIYATQHTGRGSPVAGRSYDHSDSDEDTNTNRWTKERKRRTEAVEQTTHSITFHPSVMEMGEKLDTWLGKLKNDILAEFEQSRIQTLEEQKRRSSEEKQQIICEQQRLQSELNRLSELVNTCEQSMSRKDKLIENLTQALGKQREKVCMAQAFYQCKASFSDSKREKFTDQLASQHYEKQLTLKVLRSWFSLVQMRWKKRVERACQDQAQSVCKQLTCDYEDKVKSLCDEISNLKNKVKLLQQEREQYAEQVKKAFMRGVCALNMEAMSAFSPDDGSNGRDMGGHNNNINNNLESSIPSKDEHQPKSLPSDITITAVPDLCSDSGQHQSLPTMSGGQPQKSKSKQTAKSKSRTSVASSSTSPRSSAKNLATLGQSVPLAPPMASVVVERHNPVTKQTLGKAVASRYPKSTKPEVSVSLSKSGVTSASRLQAAPQVTQTFRPLAGQTSHMPVSPGIKVVE